MTKVVSFKVRDEIYDQLKNLDGSFRDILEPLIEDYLSNDTESSYTQGIPNLSNELIENLRQHNLKGLNHLNEKNSKKIEEYTHTLNTIRENASNRLNVMTSYLKSNPVIKNRNLKRNQIQIIKDLENNYRILIEFIDIMGGLINQ